MRFQRLNDVIKYIIKVEEDRGLRKMSFIFISYQLSELKKEEEKNQKNPALVRYQRLKPNFERLNIEWIQTNRHT